MKGKERCGRRETKHTFRGNSAVQGISIDQDTLSRTPAVSLEDVD